MLKITETNLYKKELKLMLKRGKKAQKIFEIINLLVDNINKGLEHHLSLPEKYRLHKLTNGLWECHIEPDWLLIYKIDKNDIIFERTGSHSDIFNKIRR